MLHAPYTPCKTPLQPLVHMLTFKSCRPVSKQLIALADANMPSMWSAVPTACPNMFTIQAPHSMVRNPLLVNQDTSKCSCLLLQAFA